MGIARSTYYDAPRLDADDTAIVEAIAGDLRRVRSSTAGAAFRPLCGSRAWS